MRLTTGLDDRLARRLFAGRICPGLLHALSHKGVFAGVLTFTMPLLTASEGGGEFGVVGALWSDHVVHHSRTQELDTPPCEPEGRERWDSAGDIFEGNGRSFPQEFQVIVKPGHEGQ